MVWLLWALSVLFSCVCSVDTSKEYDRSNHWVGERPNSQNCTWGVFFQSLDHFSPGLTPGHDAEFSQRYCRYDKFVDDKQKNPPIFFYTGNESPVEVYINNTGLMWELGQKLGALLFFAEHRYEGFSVPKLKGTENCLGYCTTHQALADYASMISWLKSSRPQYENSPVVAFGGSYGGMLSAWLKMKYPTAISGAIAASAPIWGFPLNNPRIDGASAVISRGVSAKGGATDQCRDNLLASWPLIKQAAKSNAGRVMISKALRLCSPLEHDEVDSLLDYLQQPWFTMAEGNYPFASTYITFSVGPGYYPLPPWPMRVACEGLNEDMDIKITGSKSTVNFSVHAPGNFSVKVDWIYSDSSVKSLSAETLESLTKLFSGVEKAVSVWYNVSGNVQCHNIHAPKAKNHSSLLHHRHKRKRISHKHAYETNTCRNDKYRGSWDPICCNENLNLANTIAQGLGNDMFWPPSISSREKANLESVLGPRGHFGPGCDFASEGLFGVPKYSDNWSQWMTTSYGPNAAVSVASNIVFSNGLLDPWSSAGVFVDFDDPAIVHNVTADGSVVSVIIDLGAHHLDLMFSDPNDPPSAVEARKIEEEHILRWIS